MSITSMASSTEAHGNVKVLEPTPQLKALLTLIRNRETSRHDFIFYSNRLIRLLVEEGLNHLSTTKTTVTTPTGSQYEGVEFGGKICGVSIMRAGESMEQALRECCSSVRIGKILIQRDEATAKPNLYYSKMPPDVSERVCILLDPMLATGGSAIMAIEVLQQYGVPQEKIVFLNLIAAPKGLHSLHARFPLVKVITAEIDEYLDEKNFIRPGLGDFGCRYFGTEHK